MMPISNQYNAPSLAVLATQSYLSKEGGTIKKVQSCLGKAFTSSGFKEPPSLEEATRFYKKINNNKIFQKWINQAESHASAGIVELKSCGLTAYGVYEIMVEMEAFQLKQDNIVNRSIYGRAITQITGVALAQVIKQRGRIPIVAIENNKIAYKTWVPVK